MAIRQVVFRNTGVWSEALSGQRQRAHEHAAAQPQQQSLVVRQRLCSHGSAQLLLRIGAAVLRQQVDRVLHLRECRARCG